MELNLPHKEEEVNRGGVVLLFTLLPAQNFLVNKQLIGFFFNGITLGGDDDSIGGKLLLSLSIEVWAIELLGTNKP